MKIKYVSYLTFLFSVLYLTIVFPVSATDIPSPTPTVIQQQHDSDDDQENQNQNLEQRKLQIRRQRITNVYNHLKNELNRRHAHLLDRKIKVESKISKFEAAGKNSASAKAKLAEFTPADSTYQTDFSNLNTQIQAILQSTQPANLIPGLKTIARQVNSDLKTLKNILNQTLKLIH